MFYLILQIFFKCWWILNFLLSLPVAAGIPLKHGTFPSSDSTVAEISKVMEQETVCPLDWPITHSLSLTFSFSPPFLYISSCLYSHPSIYLSIFLPLYSYQSINFCLNFSLYLIHSPTLSLLILSLLSLHSLTFPFFSLSSLSLLKFL